MADGLAEEITQLIGKLRELDLKKQPSISETLDWARALVIMNADSLDDDVVRDTLSTIAKYEGDLAKARRELDAFVSRKKSAEAADKPADDAAAGDGSKDLLH